MLIYTSQIDIGKQLALRPSILLKADKSIIFSRWMHLKGTVSRENEGNV